MTKLDLRAITSKSIKTNVYLLLAAISYPEDGVSYIDQADLRSKTAIAEYVTDVADYRTVKKSLDNLMSNGYLEHLPEHGVYRLNEDFSNVFVEVKPEKADEMCRGHTNDQNTLLLFLLDKTRYFKGKYTTTQGRLVEDAWELSDNSQNRVRIKDDLNKLQDLGKLKWRRVKRLGTYKIEITDVHL